MKKPLLLILLSITVFLPAYSQTLGDSLVAHYFLDGNGNDAVGANHGTVYGASLTTDRNSNANSAYLFDGINDYIDIGNYTDLAITGDITVSAWVKTPSTWPSVYKDPQIYSRNTKYVSTIYGVNLFLNDPHLPNSRGFGFILKAGSTSWGNDYVLSTSTLQNSTWYFVVGVRQGSQVKIYVDGVLENTDNGSSAPIDYGPSPTANIGQKDSSSALFYDGIIDDVRIYKRALSASEIQQLFTTISSVNYSDSDNNQISIYPNPSQNYLNIDNTNKDIQINRIEIYNVSGQKINSQSFNDVNGNLQIDISDLIEGTYFIRIFDAENDFTTAKFLKLKE